MTEVAMNDNLPTRLDGLVTDARAIIDAARANAVRSVDFNLSSRLEPEYGSGFGVCQQEFGRQFYRVYPIANALRSQLNWPRRRRNTTRRNRPRRRMQNEATPVQ